MPDPIDTPVPYTIGARLPDNAEVIDGLIVIGDEAWTPAEWVLEHPIRTQYVSEELRQEAKRLKNRMSQRRFQARRRANIHVERVVVDPESAVGIGIGTVKDGTIEVIFAGDANALSVLGETLQRETTGVDVPTADWTIIRRRRRNP